MDYLEQGKGTQKQLKKCEIDFSGLVSDSLFVSTMSVTNKDTNGLKIQNETK